MTTETKTKHEAAKERAINEYLRRHPMRFTPRRRDEEAIFEIRRRAVEYGFDAGHAAATVPADDVREAVKHAQWYLDFSPTLKTIPELAPVLRTLIAAVSGDELQHELDYLYSQEQNVELSSFWDAGWRLRFGDSANGFTDDGQFDSLTEVVEHLHQRRIDGPKGDEQKEQK